MAHTWVQVLVTVLVSAAALAVALAVVAFVRRLVTRVGRRSAWLTELGRHAYRPTQWMAGLLAVHVALLAVSPSGAWRGPLVHVLGLALIAAGAWLLAALLMVVEDAALTRVRTDVRDNRRARRVHTQVTLVRRVTVAIIAVVAVGAMLMTFPAARAAGTSLLASAGVVGAVAALAAQSLLGNVFAGLQIAFSDAIRLDDVVVVEGEWGRIEDITLTYLVIHLWDDRRLVLPTSYFMSHPFQNWTRTEAALLGTVEIDLDWTVPVEPLREELRRILRDTDLWDGRVCVLQVTDAVHTMVRLRALVSAADAPTLWDLRCLVRERLVEWVQCHQPTPLPRLRLENVAARAQQWTAATTQRQHTDQDARVFGESADGEERVHLFNGPHEP
ncbi:mechanosensitive ion channel family protein [Goodfellowiella coeruleoviolacea]|uniref:Mechanosensitive ion channel n=1 Tax=Goodfellowiella coeruleoviolacea TaxID=334858 RepID=A0AAE3KEJ7_9PSEU|nr:mechanosensitive ion channel domain-containing protein [Goodfellowiella coeruleoviolacea]MCP2163972.1 Mechanosensitive ion channel [Goodfellowiella coeruleoviolacea]